MAKEDFNYAVKIKYRAGSTYPIIPDFYSEVKYFNTEDSAKKFIKEMETLKPKNKIDGTIDEMTLYAKRNDGWVAIYGLGYSISSKKVIELKNLDNKVYNEIEIEKKLSSLKKIGIAILSFIITATQFVFILIIHRYFGVANLASLASVSNLLATFFLLIIGGFYYATFRDYFQGKQKVNKTLLTILIIWIFGSL
ncbi:hypothetical protein M1310_01680 [Candidatus Marsarchaeota archaeon]|nr:hypothetical protein [Candidatus Marsarchaeota archaeon]